MPAAPPVNASQLYRAYDTNHITEDKRKELSDLADEITKRVTALIIYPGGTKLRGVKFKAREKKGETWHKLRTELRTMNSKL